MRAWPARRSTLNVRAASPIWSVGPIADTNKLTGPLVGLYLGQSIGMGTNDRWEIGCGTREGFVSHGIEPDPEYKDKHHCKRETDS